jgi:hypothetical protein
VISVAAAMVAFLLFQFLDLVELIAGNFFVTVVVNHIVVRAECICPEDALYYSLVFDQALQFTQLLKLVLNRVTSFDELTLRFLQIFLHFLESHLTERSACSQSLKGARFKSFGHTFLMGF